MLGVTAMTFFDEKNDVSSTEAEEMFLDGGLFFGGDFYFQKVSILLH